ncbi:hypothetical protein LJR168_003791 [Pseudoxanthomonas sp. LjRoot168]|uniref:hypothetical protein n=1 Tax=unclassified Pseudoxanthomonas TaxID=2645906 RepID=UPI003ED0FFBB
MTDISPDLDTYIKVRRDELIRRLVARDVARACQDKAFIPDLFLLGAQIPSYHAMSDNALKQRYQEAYGEPYVFENPAPSPMERLLSDEHRVQLIDELIEHEIDSCIAGDGVLYSRLKKGWEGFERMSDELLLGQYQEIFGERFEEDPRPEAPSP